MLEKYKNKKSIVIYFSRADENYIVGNIEKGNTEVIAEYIKDITGADIFKVDPLIPYSIDYNICINEAKQRQIRNEAPIIKPIPDLVNYDVIYIGSPIYWGGMPEEMFTALKDVDFTEKVIRPFTTHEGSGLSNVPSQLKGICKGAEILEGIAIQGSKVKMAREEIEEWINS